MVALHTLILKTSFTPWILAGPFHYLCFCFATADLFDFCAHTHTHDGGCVLQSQAELTDVCRLMPVSTRLTVTT